METHTLGSAQWREPSTNSNSSFLRCPTETVPWESGMGAIGKKSFIAPEAGILKERGHGTPKGPTDQTTSKLRVASLSQGSLREHETFFQMLTGCS